MRRHRHTAFPLSQLANQSIRGKINNAADESESDLFTGTIHGNADCYLQFCAPRLPQGAVSGRVSAAARVRPACAGLSLGRLAPVTPACLLVATSLLSIYLSLF